MSLTKQDLQAIQQIVQTTVQPMIDGAVERLAQDTAAGFAEVHERIDKVDAKIDRVDANLSRKIDRLDNKLHVKDTMIHSTVERVDRLAVQVAKLGTA